MTLGEVLLRVMKRKEKFERYASILKNENIAGPGATHTLNLFGEWFKEHPQSTEIHDETFLAWCKIANKFNDHDIAYVTNEHLQKSKPDISEDIEAGLFDRIRCEVAYNDVQALLKRYKAGEPVDLFKELKGNTDLLETELQRKTLLEPVNVSIEELLIEEQQEYGLKWRLDPLNRATRPLRPGDFGIIAARPDAGKTSFLSSELTFMAGQLEEGCPVVWLNNEGPGRRITARCYQAALNCTMSELSELQKQGVLQQKYADAIGGKDQLQIFDVHDAWSYDVENIIKKTKAGVVVFDMIDNIKFAGANHLGGTRTDQILETMYQWARNLAVKYECIVLATSQISADGDNMRYPMLPMLKDSKTGKQGASDFVLMIGRDQDRSDTRFLSLPKNKLALSNAPKDPRCEVYFDGARSRYNELARLTEADMNDNLGF